MAYADLVSYIQEQTQQGISAQTLREALMESGWLEADIENALHDVAAGLHPATPGASIHEDLAQVRGMVAHLATRVGNIESMLPSAFIGPDHELTAEQDHSTLWRIVSVVVLVGLAVWLGSYTPTLMNRWALAPMDQVIMVAALGLVLMLAAVAALVWRAPWTASLLTAIAVAVWMVDVFVAWHAYQLIELVIAVGLAVLLLAIVFALGRWISRMRA